MYACDLVWQNAFVRNTDLETRVKTLLLRGHELNNKNRAHASQQLLSPAPVTLVNQLQKLVQKSNSVLAGCSKKIRS